MALRAADATALFQCANPDPVTDDLQSSFQTGLRGWAQTVLRFVPAGARLTR